MPSRLPSLLTVLAVLLVSFVSATPARAWWNGDWPYRMKIDVDLSPKGGNVAAPIGRTQILVRLYSGNFNFSTLKDDGSDLRFVAADDKTPLRFHIARIDTLVDQVALVWVDIPDLAPGATTPFYLYWGNKNATAGGDPHATYDPDQVLVYQFGNPTGLPQDVTANGLNALTGGKRDDAGITGFALRLDGTAPVQLPQSPLLALTAGQAATWSMWLQFDDAHNTAALLSATDAQASFLVGLDQGVPYAQVAQAGQTQRSTPGPVVKGGGWHLLDVVADAGKIDLYVDGKPNGELAAGLPAIAGQVLLGGAPAPAAPAPADPNAPPAAPQSPDATTATPAPPAALPNFVGLLDEFEYSRVARPLGAIQLAADEQGPDANVLTFEKPEQSSLWGTGTLGIIIKSVDSTAWVVISLLMLMLVISWVVMVSKALYVTKLSRANQAFREDFLRAAVADEGYHLTPMSEEKRPILKGSSLWRIYRIGGDELRARIKSGRLIPGEPVPTQSLTAIRSSLDAAYVRETRRLNGAMVLLTIAIAGGPFIGLLGTVIGVMVTFAAIAAAGDVNINAIAPGISAALLATVAGLAVAIPALFGYNYFTIKIRDATSEMAVFIEELIARIGEGANPNAGRATFEPAAGE
jgi:biopolymer transport protein ExbB